MAETRAGKPRKRKQLRNTFRLSVILLFFVLSILISFIIYALKFDISSKPIKNMPVPDSENLGMTIITDENKNKVSEESSSESDSQSTSVPSGAVNPVAQSERKDDSYLEKSVFVGDSITAGLSGYKFVSPENVLASIGLRIDNVTTEQVETPLLGKTLVLDALTQINPENVYIMLGMNGVAWYDVENGNKKMIDEYSAFIDSIREKLPETDIYIISLTPVGTKKEQIETAEKGRVLNTEIDVFNEKLLALANEKSVYYVDVNTALKDSNGKLSDEDTTDGMHFVKDVYGEFIEYILTHTA